MSKGQTLQDPFLNALRKDRIPVSIFLVNGIKLQGQIESFDQYVILLRNTVSQMVYKHAISTVVPTRNPRTDGMSAQGAGSGNPSFGGGNGPNYPMGNNFERQGGFGSGSVMRGGFTRTSPNQGFDRGGYHQQGGFGRQDYDRGFGGGFDRQSYEERGFDGKNFEKDFDANKTFNDAAFSDSDDFDNK